MSGNDKKSLHLVKTYVRERPFTNSEIEKKLQDVVHAVTKDELFLKSGNIEKKYNFDRVFSRSSSQEEIYDAVVSPLVNFVLGGYMCTVFAYGPTGTGKTHTMIGRDVGHNTDFENDPFVGIIPRAAMQIFAELQKLNIEHSIKISFIEIYNEEVRDLLVKDGAPLKVYDDPQNKGATCLKGVNERVVTSIQEVYELLATGTAVRQTAATNLNRLSSRSHTIFSIVINTREVTPEGEEIVTIGKLHMVDLAGSENIGRSGATEMRAREAGSINKSLLTLRKVIKALALKMQHIPYRESKLTRILQDSLGGKCKTSMIATFSPCITAFDETLNTLDYANVARSVQNSPTCNVNRKQTAVLKEFQDEVKQLRDALNAARAGDGFYMSASEYEKINFEIKSKKERIATLIKEINRMEEQIDEKQKLYNELSASYEESNATLENMNKELQEEKAKLEECKSIKNFIQGDLLEITEIAQKLEEDCDSSTKHEDIYFQKYESLCDSTLTNAQTAKNVYVLGATCLEEIQNSTHDFYNLQGTQLDNLKDKTKTMQQVETNNVQRINQILSNIDCKKNFWKLNFEDVFKKEELLEKVISFYDGNKDAQLNELDDTRTCASKLDSLVMENTLEVKTQISKCEQAFHKQITDYKNSNINLQQLQETTLATLQNERSHVQEQLLRTRKIRAMETEILEERIAKHAEMKRELELVRRLQEDLESYEVMHANAMKPVTEMRQTVGTLTTALLCMEALPLQVQETITDINILKEDGGKNIQSYENKTREYLKEFMDSHQEKVKENDDDYKDTLVGWSKELHTVIAGLDEIKHGLHDVATHVDVMASTQKVHEADLQHFIKTSMQDIEKLINGVKTEVHVGDTPVKPEYNCHEIPKFMKEEELTLKHRRLFADSPQQQDVE